MRIALIHRLRQQIRNLWGAEDGNVALIFSIALIPIIGLAGGAIDYSRASAVKTTMQAALDATALAMSKEAAKLSAAELSEKAAAYFKAAFNGPQAQNIKITATYSKASASSVTVSGSGQIGTTFLGILGIDTIPIESYAKTAWGMGKVRLALVLDNSGSMADQGRMTALKAATKDMLKTFQAAAMSPGDIQVAVVPFNENVNVGSSNYNQAWIDWTDWDAANASNDPSGISGSICYNGKLWIVNGLNISYGGSCSSPSTGICYNGTLWNWNGLKLVNSGSCGNIDHSSWNGCVVDRNEDYDVQNTMPTPSDKATLFPAKQATPCPESIMGLSDNWTSLNAKVDAMVSAGFTNQPIGLAWGWLALSPTQPMNAPAINDKNTKQYIVLLSDGENTKSRWYTGSDAEDKINARQKKVCDNIKAAGIEIFSVLLIEGDENVMRDCASKPEMFYHLTSSSQVIGAFSDIGTKISKLRIAQ